jgi:hypothetical protein
VSSVEDYVKAGGWGRLASVVKTALDVMERSFCLAKPVVVGYGGSVAGVVQKA